MVVGKPEDNGEYIDVRFREPSYETKWESFKKAIYNPSTNAVLGRTGKSWAQLLLFYAIFYVILAALFAICMQGLFATLNDKEPTWTLDKSWIGTNPGLGVRPVSNRFEEGSLIWYNMTNQTQIGKWVHLINDFLAPYNASQTGTNYVNCDFDKPPGEGQVCASDLSKLGNCNRGRAYGYNSSSPCIFLKLNRIIGWEPEYFTTPQTDMPDELKIHIQNNTSSELEKKQVWVSCQGVDTIDRQHVMEFRYYPQGFASYYYPYKNYPNYLSPIVAVEIINLTPNVIISIECRAWAKNIIYRGGVLNRAGSIQFEMQVDAATESPK